MNKKLFIAASILTVSGLLAACGTDEAAETTEQDTATETEQQQNDTAVSEESTDTEETEESAEEDSSSAEGGDENAEPAEENPAAAEGTLTVSDAETYELYVLPGYELTAEEPNKDVVFATENDSLFMRVETFSKDETDFAFAEETMLETLKASNADAELTELPAFEEAEFINSSVAEIPTENGKVTGAVFETDSQIVRLTIFDLTEASVTEDFLNMGKTITAK